MTTNNNSLNILLHQNPEDAVKEFIIDTLGIDSLPKGSLHDILKSGVILCQLIKRLSVLDPSVSIDPITIRTANSKFAYHDNIGQFLKAAHDLSIPQSDLFQTVDLLEGKRMQSVISSLLAIKRLMNDRLSSSMGKKSVKHRSLLTAQYGSSPQLMSYGHNGKTIKQHTKGILTVPNQNTEPFLLEKKTSHLYQKPQGNKLWLHDKPKLQDIFPTKPPSIPPRKALPSTPKKPETSPVRPPGILSTHLSVMGQSHQTRRLSSSSDDKPRLKPIPSPIPTSSKSTPLIAHLEDKKIMKKSKIDSLEQANRKASLKKMGTCAITVKHSNGTNDTYALGRSIGKGQFGEVFGGLNMDTGEYVAIKRIKRSEINCDDMNEVGVLQHLNNEYIVRYKGFSKDKEYINIILEYVEMGSLLNNIKGFGKFPEKLAASYTYKILSGLQYLHSKSVVHRDLKAANILITKTGGLKLTDFGVSLSLQMDKNTGEPAGTPNWMAPEVIKFAGASDKSDIWSLGCTIVEMLTGKPPYGDVPSFTALYRIVEDEEPPIPKKIKLSEDVTEFLLACFKKNPEDRPSANELMKFKWMAPYVRYGTNRLNVDKPLKKSKSDTYIHEDTYRKHDFVQYSTMGRYGGLCPCCSESMNSNIKQCQECQIKVHSNCTQYAGACLRTGDQARRYSTTKDKYTTKPSYRSAPQTRSYLNIPESENLVGQKKEFRSERYYQTKQYEPTRRNPVSSVMT